MSTWGIPQLFAIWRKSVLLTVGAISLGAEQLESPLDGILRRGGRADRAPRVKVPVRAGKIQTRRTGRAAVVRKAARTATDRAATSRRPRVKTAHAAETVAQAAVASPSV